MSYTLLSYKNVIRWNSFGDAKDLRKQKPALRQGVNEPWSILGLLMKLSYRSHRKPEAWGLSVDAQTQNLPQSGLIVSSVSSNSGTLLSIHLCRILPVRPLVCGKKKGDHIKMLTPSSCFWSNNTNWWDATWRREQFERQLKIDAKCWTLCSRAVHHPAARAEKTQSKTTQKRMRYVCSRVCSTNVSCFSASRKMLTTFK